VKRFYLSGQRTFGNRGCEAIVRSTVDLLRAQFGEIEVLVPSVDIPADRAQWPQAPTLGVRFVRAYAPPQARYWVHLQRLPLPALKRARWPFPMPRWLRKDLSGVDAVLAVGGDNYSLDYRIPSPVMALDRYAMDMGKPVMLWGASVGPFEREPAFVAPIRRHLARMDCVAARESASHHYLTDTLGLANVIQMADPAFVLQAEAVDRSPFWPSGEAGVLGINVSPLIERYRYPGGDLRAEIADFIRHAVKDLGFGVLLVPHVNPLRGDGDGGDVAYMEDLLAQVADLGSAVTMMPSTFNAAQCKHVIGRVRFFMGARTHATIAALSSGVPTISIAYSVKARGINRDVFGSEDMVLQTPEVSAASLRTSLDWLLREEQTLRSQLAARVVQVQQAARIATSHLATVLAR
jgi:colanic acid/amylovoran biosynthesis protein